MMLIINDSAAIDALAGQLDDLHAHGHHVYLCSKDVPDIAEVTYVHPDVILLEIDVHDDLSHWHLLERLKLHPATTQIPILLLCTPDRGLQDLHPYLQSQQIVVLEKPVALPTLLATFQDLASAQATAS